MRELRCFRRIAERAERAWESRRGNLNRFETVKCMLQHKFFCNDKNSQLNYAWIFHLFFYFKSLNWVTFLSYISSILFISFGFSHGKAWFLSCCLKVYLVDSQTLQLKLKLIFLLLHLWNFMQFSASAHSHSLAQLVVIHPSARCVERQTVDIFGKNLGHTILHFRSFIRWVCSLCV